MPESSPENSEVTEAKAAETSQVTNTPDVKPTDSSPAESKSDKGSMLDAVQAALKPEPAEKPLDSDKKDPKSEEKPDDAEKKDGEEGDDEGELSEEEKSQLKAKTRRRIERLSKERGEALAEVQKLTPAAEGFQKIVRFVEEKGISPGEVNQLFDVGANLKNDPRKAYDQIKPIWEKLDAMFGNGLPDDLRTQVAQGFITEEMARGYAKARTDAAILQQQNDQRRQRETQRQDAERHQAHVSAVKTAITGWETDKEGKDPDWKLKQSAVNREIRLAISEQGFPATTEAAVKMADDALKTVETEFRRLIPQKREIKPTPTDAASTRSVAKPANHLDAVLQAL